MMISVRGSTDPSVTPARPEWVFVETIESTDRPADEVKAQFLASHPELQDVDPKSVRMDVICGRNPAKSWLRFWRRSDAVPPD
jgi:hypothetical protein